MGLALDLIGVEQGIARALAPHQRELPGQIGGVADAGAEALPHERRRLMAGVAEQEDAARAPTLGQQRVKAVDRRAPDFYRGRIDEAGKLGPHAVGRAEFFRYLARQELDLPAAQVPRADDVGRGPRGPAILNAFLRQIDGLDEPRVDHHPPFVEGQILVLDAERSAHEAVRPVAAEDVTRRDDAIRRAVRRAQRDIDAIGVRRKRDGLGAEKDVHPPGSRHAGAQHGFDLGLHEAQARRPAERMGRRLRVVDANDATVDAEIMRARIRCDERRDLIRYAAGLKNPHHLVVERNRARLVVDVGALLDHGDTQPMAREQCRHGGAHRPIADDEDIMDHAAWIERG